MSSGPVAVTILDAHGEVVRRYSSDEHVPSPDPATLQFAPEWVVPAPVPSSAAGMQRFVWNLRYAERAVPGAKGPPKDGVWAPPGRYTVKLTVDGREYQQPLTVAADPRVKASNAALQRQFELARKVEAQQLQVSTALAHAEKLLDGLDARLATAGRLRRQIGALLAKAINISGTRPHAGRAAFPAVPPQRSDSLDALSFDLLGLESAVDGADADPSPDALTSYATLSRTLAATLAQWNAFERTDVAKLNARLKGAGQRPI